MLVLTVLAVSLRDDARSRSQLSLIGAHFESDCVAPAEHGLAWPFLLHPRSPIVNGKSEARLDRIFAGLMTLADL